MKNASTNLTTLSNESTLDVFLKTNIFFFELSLYVLYSLIFLFGILGNSVVIYVLLSSILFERKRVHKEHTTVINSPNTNSGRAHDSSRHQLKTIRDNNKLHSMVRKFLKEKLTVTNFYLLNLAITDFFYLLFIPILLCTMLSGRWLFGFLFCKVYFCTVYLCQCSSVFILVVLSVDRYLSVKYPLKTSTFRTDQVARAVICISWLLSLLFIIPVMVYTEYQPIGSSCRMHWPDRWNFDNHSSSFSRVASTYLAPLQLFNIYTFLLNYLIPVSIIVILYTQILHNLEKNSLKNTATNRSKSKRKSHRHITKMVLAIIICYITCWTPYWCYQIAIYVYNQIFNIEAPFVLVIISHFVQVIAYMSSALNPFIYSYMSEAFRANLNWAFNCCRRRAEPGVEMREVGPRKGSQEARVARKEEVSGRVDSASSVDRAEVDASEAVVRGESSNLLADGDRRPRPRLKFVSLSATQPEPEPFRLERQTGSASNLDTRKSPSKIPSKKLTFLNASNSKLKFEINFHGLKYFKR